MNHLSILVTALGGLSAAVSTLPAQSWVATTAPSANWGAIACSADGRNLLVGIGPPEAETVGVLYVSHDSGAAWTTAGTAAGTWSSVASSADGAKLVAADSLHGLIYTSDDSGSSWRTSNVPKEVWNSVACSADGTRLVAASGSGGIIYRSVDSGQTWAATGAPSGGWVSIASSADGHTLVAADGANVWVSTNSGATFQATPVTNGYDPAFVACSADGTKLAAGIGSGVVISADSGATWASYAVFSNYISCASAACSADGTKLAVLGVAGDPMAPAGYILISGNSGATWLPTPSPIVGLPPGYWDWSGIAITADGCKLTAAASDGAGFFGPLQGGVFVLQSTPAPPLAIARSGGSLVLSSVVLSIDFVLQQSPDLGTTNWTDVPGTPVLDYSTLRNQVAVPAPAGPMFYRLASP